MTDFQQCRSGGSEVVQRLNGTPTSRLDPTNLSGLEGKDRHLHGLLTFEDPSVLRAVRVSDVMAGAGKVFDQRDGCDFFTHSEVTDRIHTFVSHNWTTSRWSKFLVIACHFNMDWGLLAACLCILTFVLWRSITGGRHWWGLLHYVTSPIMYSTIFWGRAVASAFKLKGPRLFVDGCCIHQTDRDLQKKGIEKLGAFMHHSDNLLVCFSDAYLKKIWTVFEVCTFMVLGRVSHLFVIPVILPCFALFVSVQIYLAGGLLLGACFNLEPTPEFWFAHLHIIAATSLSLGVSTASIIVIAARRYFQLLSGLSAQIHTFDIRTADCRDEDDRIYIETAIVTLMRHVDRPREGEVNTDTLLEEFNSYVRTEVPKALRSSVGPAGIPLKQILVVWCVPMTTMHLELFAYFGTDDPPLLVVLRSCTAACLLALFVAAIAKRYLGLTGCPLVAYFSIVVWLIAILVTYLDYDWESTLLSRHTTSHVLQRAAGIFRWVRAGTALLLCAHLILRFRKRGEELLKLELMLEPEADAFTL